VRKGTVFLVGAGPGDPALITRKGAECLRRADVVIYDRLISKELLYLAPEDAELIYVGKRPGEHTRNQQEINDILLDKAKEGKILVRLKGGDPFVFGRGAEEAMVLARAGISFEIVPGVTSAVAAAAYAGIPLTHRDWTSSVALITGHEAADKNTEQVSWSKIGSCIGTIVVYMGVKNFRRITTEIMAGGRAGKTPAAVIHAGTTPFQKTVSGTLETIAGLAEENGILPPALLVIGDVVGLRRDIAWHENRPLFGKRLAVTRSRTEESSLAEELRRQGAMVIEFPTIRILPATDTTCLHEQLIPCSKFDWIVFFSPTAVRYFFATLIEAHGDARNLHGTRIAVRDRSTANVLREYGLHPDFGGQQSSALKLIEGLIEQNPELGDKKILLPQRTENHDRILSLLQGAGAIVSFLPVYHIDLVEGPTEEFIESYEDRLLNGITFTSTTSVVHFLKLMKVPDFRAFQGQFNIFSLGPVTSQKVRDYHGWIDAEAKTHTIAGLTEKICEFYRTSAEGQGG